MGRLTDSWHLYYAGAVILLALTLGGGTAQGLWTDHLLQIAMLPALFLGLGRMSSTRLDLAGRLLVAAILVLLIAQFIPVWRSPPMQDLLGTGGMATLSPAPHKSLESALFAISILGFFLFLARFSDRDQERCLRFLLIGFAINVAAGALQLSYEQRATLSHGLPFTITAGLFANENHLSSLVYVVIPLLGYRFLARLRLVFVYLVITFLIVGFLFAVGSRAGTAIAATSALLSLIWFLPRNQALPVKLCLLAAWLASVVVISLLLGFDAALADDLRLTFFTTTWEAIRDHPVFGTGLGTFTLIYPGYEAREDVIRAYANHAHNDFLELLLETGIAGIILLAAFLILVLRNFSRSRLAEAAFIAMLALFMHSLVDYPLRTMALGVVFAWLAAIILSVKPFGEKGVAWASKAERPQADFIG